MFHIFSGLKEKFQNTQEHISQKIETTRNTFRNKILAIAGWVLIGASSPSMAGEWKVVDTPGIGPREFALQNFGTENWKGLVWRDGRKVVNPSTDLILGREYTLVAKKKENEVLVERNETPQKQKKTPTIITEKEVPKKSVTISQAQSLLKKLFSVEYGDLMWLDFPTYKTAIAWSESGGLYTARNDVVGKKSGVHPSKWAWGKYQFTTATLERYGVYLMERGVISERRVNDFLGNPALQEELMEQYTRENIDRVRNNRRLAQVIELGKKPLPEILAKWHIGWPGSLEHTGKKTDWMKTPVTKYAKTVGKKYLSLIAANDSNDTKISKSEDIVSIVPEWVQTIAFTEQASANDAVYNTQKRTESVLSSVQNETLRASIAQKFAPYPDERTAIHAYMNKDRNEAIRLKKLALTIVWPSRDTYLKQAALHVKRANDLKIVLDRMDEMNTPKLRKAA